MSLYLKRVGSEEKFYLAPDKEKILIGRAIQCDISFPSVHISRQHCQIIRSRPNGALIIKNIRDTNCTYVNEVKLQNPDVSAELQVGCCIGLGVPLVLAEGDGLRNRNYVFLKLEGSQSSAQTRQSEARRPEVRRNSEVGVHLQSGEAPPAITPSDNPPKVACVQDTGKNSVISSHANLEQRVPTLGLRPHKITSSEDLNSELEPAGVICPTSHNEPPVSSQNGMSQSSYCATTTSSPKGRFQQNSVDSEVGDAEEFKLTRHPGSTTEGFHIVKPNIVTDENDVAPMQARDLCHKPKQVCSKGNESDVFLAKNLDDQRVEPSVNKKLHRQLPSVSDISSAPSQSAASLTVKRNEMPSSPISIDLTLSDPESPICSKFSKNFSKKQLKEIIAKNLNSIASPEIEIISPPETSQGKRKRVNDEVRRDSVEVSNMKKIKRINLNAHKSDSNENSDNENEALPPKAINQSSNKSEDNDSESLPSLHIDEGQKSDESGVNKALSDSDDESLFLSRRPRESSNESIQNEVSEVCDSESFVCLPTTSQDSNKCRSWKTSSEGDSLCFEGKSGGRCDPIDSDSDSECLIAKRKPGHVLLVINSSDDSDGSDIQHPTDINSEPLLTKRRRPGHIPLIIYSSDDSDDSDIQVSAPKKGIRTKECKEKIDSFPYSSTHSSALTVTLNKLPAHIHEGMTVKVDRKAFLEDNSPGSSKREKNTSNKTCINSDKNKLSLQSHFKGKRKRTADDESHAPHVYEEELMQKPTTVKQLKCTRLQNECLGESSSPTVSEDTTRKDEKEGTDVAHPSERISSGPSASHISADSRLCNKVIKAKKDSNESSHKDDEKSKAKEPSKTEVSTAIKIKSEPGMSCESEENNVSTGNNANKDDNKAKEPNKNEVSTEIKIKVEPGLSCESDESNDSAGNNADKDEVVFMYSQVGEEIWISSDEEEETSPSGPASTWLDEDLNFLFAEEDDPKPASSEVCNTPDKMPDEVDNTEMNDQACDDDEDQWFPLLSQSFLESSDEETNKDEKCNKDSKDASLSTVDSEPTPGPSGVNEPLPDSEESESDEWWPNLSQGFFDDDEVEEQEDAVVTSDNNKMDTEVSNESATTGDIYLQSVIEKLKKKSPRTSQLTEAKIPLQVSKKNNLEANSFYKSSRSPATVKKKDTKKKQEQSVPKNTEPLKKPGRKNKGPDLRKTLTSKFNLESYKATVECRSKEKHHLVSQNKGEPSKPPSHPVPSKGSDKKVGHTKDRENISIQRKAKPVDPTSQDKAHSKVAAKVTKKSRFEKLIDCDIFSKPSKSAVLSKGKRFKIPKSSSGTSSVHSEVQGCKSVLDKRKHSKVAENNEQMLLDTTEPQPQGSSDNEHIKNQTLLPSSSAPLKNGRTDEICKDLQRIKLKSKGKKVHFPQKEEDLVKVLLISPRKNGERTGLPSVKARETLPEKLILNGKNVPPYYMECFVHHVCHWNYDWLECYHTAQEKYRAGASRKIPPPPPVVSRTNNPTLILYGSYDDYKETHSSLFYLELWERIYKDWLQSRQKNHNLQALVEFVKPAYVKTPSNTLRFWAVKLMVAVPQTHNKSSSDFRQGTLVSLKVRKEAKKSVIFGYIDYMVNNRQMAVASQNQGSAQINCSSFSLGIRVAKETMQTVKPGTGVTLDCISYIRPSSRIWESLCKLPLSPLCKDILSPSVAAFSCERETKYLVEKLPLNEVQEKAVTTISSKCMYDSHIPKISLIHGPPGTGKTSTIVALVAQMALMGRFPVPGSIPYCRVLICAPSNAAVDEMTLRLIHLRDIGLSLRVVRVGFKISNHPLVRGVTLDQLIDKHMRMETSTPKCNSAKQEWQRRKILLQEVAAELEKARKEGKHNEIRQLEARLNEMARARAEFEKSCRNELSGREKYEQEQRLQQEFLLNAEVITTTLNSCVSGVMGEVLSKHQYHFTCCIVDEAGQCQETESLLPLLLGMRKLVLVGDHHQLPATVLSQVALSKNLKQSLFERMYHRLVLELQREDVVHTLRIQYRMHPEIVAWPAQHFYLNKLITPPELGIQARDILQPYMIFDLKSSQEERLHSGEMYNPAEASLVNMLLEVLQPHLSHKSVGVITPYQRQRIYLEEKLARFKGPINLSINTIDGFQGQEKDVIILSFVRANKSANIGFLSHRQRLNVALTRAKKTCYIVANLSSLEGNEEWNALIRNGRVRGLVCPVTRKEENDRNFIRSVVVR